MPPSLKFFSSGTIGIDEIIGGIPNASITLIEGSKSAGKTSLCLKMAASFIGSQHRDVLYINSESPLDPRWVIKHGITGENIIFFDKRILTLEFAGEMIIKALNDDNIGLVILDSIAAIPIRQEKEGEIGDNSSSQHENTMSRFLANVQGDLKQRGKALIVTDQRRTNFRVLFGNQLTNTSGLPMEHYTHLTPVCSSSERKSGLDGYILKKRVANLSFFSIYTQLRDRTFSSKRRINPSLNNSNCCRDIFSPRLTDPYTSNISFSIPRPGWGGWRNGWLTAQLFLLPLPPQGLPWL